MQMPEMISRGAPPARAGGGVRPSCCCSWRPVRGSMGRCGKLTAVEAALESSLSVEEAERMLQELAAKGHLEVSIEHGRLHYALWDREAPL